MDRKKGKKDLIGVLVDILRTQYTYLVPAASSSSSASRPDRREQVQLSRIQTAKVLPKLLELAVERASSAVSPLPARNRQAKWETKVNSKVEVWLWRLQNHPARVARLPSAPRTAASNHSLFSPGLCGRPPRSSRSTAALLFPFFLPSCPSPRCLV